MSKPPDTPRDADHIRNVADSTNHELWVNRRKRTLPILIGGMIWLIACLSVGPALLPDTGLWLFLGPLPFAYLLALYFLTKSDMHRTFMQQFAKRHGLSFQARTFANDYDGVIFRMGDSHSFNNLAAGYINNFPVLFYNLTVFQRKRGLLSSNKETESFDFTVYEITARHPMPQLFLDSKSTRFGSKRFGPFQLDSSRALKLEGDFNKHFALYIPREYEIEALQIFTPDVMLELIETSKQFELEIIGQQIRLIVVGHIESAQQMDDMYAHATRIASLFETTFSRFKYQKIGSFTDELNVSRP